jgi:double-strand break repair protein MRE11
MLYLIEIAPQTDSDSDDVVEIDDDDDEPPKAKRTNRAAVLRYVYVLTWQKVSNGQCSSTAAAKKATPKKKAGASSSKQATLSFAPSGRTSTRAAATKAKGKMAVSVAADEYVQVADVDDVLGRFE